MGNPVEDYVDCYQNLANAIILLAVKDYKTILRCLMRNPYNQDAQREKKRLERFFFSQWFGVLTDLDPKRLISGVMKQMRVEEEERRKRAQEKLRLKAEVEEQRMIDTLFQLLHEVGAVILLEDIRRLQTG